MVTYTVGENDDVRRIRRCIVLSTVVIGLFFILAIGIFIGVFYYLMMDFKSDMGGMGDFMSMMGGGGGGAPAAGGPYGGKQQPGMQQPGMQQPGMQQPDMQQPGIRDPDAVRQRPGDGSQQPNDMPEPGMPEPGMSEPGAQPGMAEPDTPQGGSYGQPGTGIQPEPSDPDKETSVAPEPDSGSTTKPNTPTDGNIAHNTLYLNRLEFPSPTTEGTKYSTPSQVATSSFNTPKRDSSTSPDTTTADGSLLTGNADTTFRLGERNSVDNQPSEGITHSGIVVSRTETLHLTETTTAMKLDNKLQIVSNVVTTETPRNNLEITESGVPEFRYTRVDAGIFESQRRIDDDSNGELNPLVTTTHDGSTDKEDTSHAVWGNTQSGANIVDTDTTSVVSYSEDLVQESRRAASTESVASQTTATVNVVIDNNGNAISKNTKDTFSIENTVNSLDNHGYSSINGELTESTTRDTDNGEITDSLPDVKATNIADRTNTNVDSFHSTESTTLSNVGESDPGDDDKIAHIRPTGGAGTTEGRIMTSAITDTKNRDFSDIYATYLNTKSQEHAKTSQVNNLDTTLKNSMSSSPSPDTVNVKEILDDIKTTENTETLAVLGGTRKITTFAVVTRKVDLLTNHSSVGLEGSNSESITPKASNIQHFTDDSSQVSDANADAIDSIQTSDTGSVTKADVTSEELKYNTVVNDKVSYIQDVTAGITDSSDVQENTPPANIPPANIEDNGIGNNQNSDNKDNGVNKGEASDVVEFGIANIALTGSKDKGFSSVRPSDNDIGFTELSDYEDNGAGSTQPSDIVENNSVGNTKPFDLEENDADNFQHSGNKDNFIDNVETSDVDNNDIASSENINTKDKDINSTRSSDTGDNVIEITEPADIEYDNIAITQHSDVDDNAVGSTQSVNFETNGLESTQTSDVQDTSLTSTQLPNVNDNAAGSTQPADIVDNGGESTQPSVVEHNGASNTQPSGVDKNIERTQSPKVDDIDAGNTYSSDVMDNGVDSTQSSDVGNNVVNYGVIDTQSSDSQGDSIESTQALGVEYIVTDSTQSADVENTVINSTQPTDGEDNGIGIIQLSDVEDNDIENNQSLDVTQSSNLEANGVSSTKLSGIEDNAVKITKPFEDIRDSDIASTHPFEGSIGVLDKLYSTKTADNLDDRDILAATERRKHEATTTRTVSRNTQETFNGDEGYSTEMISLEVAKDGGKMSSDFGPYSLGVTQVSNVEHYVTERVESSNTGVESAERKNSMIVTTNDISRQAQTISSTNKGSTVIPPEPPDITQTSITYTEIQWTKKTTDSVFPVTHALGREATTDIRGTSDKEGTVGNIDNADTAGTFLVTTETNKSEVEGRSSTVIPDNVLPDTTDDLNAEATTHLPVIVYNNADHVDDADTTDNKWTTVKADDFHKSQFIRTWKVRQVFLITHTVRILLAI